MKEYIERVTALNALIRALGYCQCANDVITRIPAADVAEVRHGRWIRQPSEISGLDVEFCSECGQGMNERNQFWNAKYCPHCGALMREDDNGKE